MSGHKRPQVAEKGAGWVFSMCEDESLSPKGRHQFSMFWLQPWLVGAGCVIVICCPWASFLGGACGTPGWQDKVLRRPGLVSCSVDTWPNCRCWCPNCHRNWTASGPCREMRLEDVGSFEIPDCSKSPGTLKCWTSATTTSVSRGFRPWQTASNGGILIVFTHPQTGEINPFERCGSGD